MEIRNVRTNDLKGIHKLLEDLIKERPPVALELEGLLTKDKKWLKSFPRGSSGVFLVAEYKGEIIGFCYVAIPKFRILTGFVGIAVDKNHRKGGLGTKILQQVIDWAEISRLKYVIADTWNWNKGAQKFFQKNSFKKMGVFEDKFKGKIKKKVRLIYKV